jgi:hypothetical protein
MHFYIDVFALYPNKLKRNGWVRKVSAHLFYIVSRCIPILRYKTTDGWGGEGGEGV